MGRWAVRARPGKLRQTGAICALLSACASHVPPSEQTLLAAAGWLQEDLAGASFRHRLYSENLPQDISSLHIYIGGDGRAFLNKNTVARDPTPSGHLALRLALADAAPSGFLSRPCYYGAAMATPCAPKLWTVDRYAPVVIDSMVAALQEVATRFPRAELTLVGYSGGGVIALLTARRLDAVVRVVTVAAPLDTLAWTTHHGYTPLSAGSNPAAISDWSPELEQIHLGGADDNKVPPAVLNSFMAKTNGAAAGTRLVVFPGFDHHCCWLQNWPDILGEVLLTE